MDLIRTCVREPVTVSVGVILTLLAGFMALSRLPIQLTPNVESTVVSVMTFWRGASPREVEQEIADKQEEKLQGIPNLISLKSTSQQGQASIRLEFAVGTRKEEALREVSDKLREVPTYPDDVDEPVISASDPRSRDYIAWISLSCGDRSIDIRTLGDYARDRIQPILERVAGVSEVNVLGGREREIQIRFDPSELAARGLTPADVARRVRSHNVDLSAGAVPDGKLDVRLRTVGQYNSVESVGNTILSDRNGTPIYLRDVADVVDTYKEATSFVRSIGEPVVIMNVQREFGSNVMEVMARLKRALADLNRDGGLLDAEAESRGLNGTLRLNQVYDQTVYIHDAIGLVTDNIWIGGSLAVVVLLLFLRSFRSVGIVALAIPISVVGSVVAMVAMGRSVNVVSLAGMAFAVGMVVDNAIVVLENIFRHVEMGKRPYEAALDGAKEVWGAVLASTLTTVVVFIPILLIEAQAGQLFRDIALAICASVAISMIVAITVIPSASARLLRKKAPADGGAGTDGDGRTSDGHDRSEVRDGAHEGQRAHSFWGRIVYSLSGSFVARLGIVAILTCASLIGSYILIPPADYLPRGNRNLVMGMLISPSGYNLRFREELADRIESTVRPFIEVGRLDPESEEYAEARSKLPKVPTFNFMTMSPGPDVVPPPLTNYFIVSFEGMLFQGGVSVEPDRVADLAPLLQYATRPDRTPGVIAMAFQAPLFQVGGSTGAAISIDFTGEDLDEVTAAAGLVYGRLVQEHSVMSVQPEPSNFNIPGPEIQAVPRARNLARLGMSNADLGLAVQTSGDGALLGEYRADKRAVDLKLISIHAVKEGDFHSLEDVPIATPSGRVVPLSSLAEFRRLTSPPQINRVNRERAVTLQFTPPEGVALEAAVEQLGTLLTEMRDKNQIPRSVQSHFTGTASKLDTVLRALVGDGSWGGMLTSSLALALLVVYLLMCVLFQSFAYPFVIMFSVPLATLGGFLALRIVFLWSAMDRYLPLQLLDVLTMLGFVILIGVVVNNAILIVHQALTFMRGSTDRAPMPPREAIAESVATRVRPIFMSTLTSLGGMLPLVLMPGAGSELYRGLGSVVLGGLLVSTIFTLVLVPLLLSLVVDFRSGLKAGSPVREA
ncbi:MAG: efflux RND transporter permease subunit [Planctomycetota bacterium]